ncbi:helix-turn-helix domain-containing protein [Paenibacillus woosongensis]|uniref:Helix-turn-helix domain-containing protein n=1 Tax=Paenibacillus woosongensis TaxID=307580 RepID=A0A7X2Z3C5_9BACL|nr:helix-turn-helix transcriptional regulator [Paenibacillus woosongensis]MUG46731.1 helix-turn-helix domain-containing protein [Paenibacillus woosongensis]
MFKEGENNVNCWRERIRRIQKLHKQNQIEFTKFIGVSQGTLSELEQKKYKLSLDMILAIHNHFNVDLLWLLLGEGTLNKADKIQELIEQETAFLSIFKKLTDTDQSEIIDFIKMKIRRYS